MAGLFLTGWQWVASGFRPRLVSRIDANREAIEIKIRNRGRASGIVERVAVVAPLGDDLEVQEATFNGFPVGRFAPFIVPGAAAVRLIIEAPDSGSFRPNISLIIDVGEAQARHVVPRHDSRVSLFGLRSVMPPR
ncbi:hypothetical protein [Kribbella sp. NBC_00359]|uniref:hypothetical protein n=1 Tax=Kribbella sp. NBC_00359 TaxID=2975966 RepID=UPI002E1CDB0D